MQNILGESSRTQPWLPSVGEAVNHLLDHFKGLACQLA